MKYQILFSGGKKKKNITNLLSAELVQRVLKVKIKMPKITKGHNSRSIFQNFFKS